MHLTESWKQRRPARITIRTSPRLLRSLNRHRRRVKTKRFGAATLVDGESTSVIAPIPVVLVRHEAKVIRVPGRKAKDQSESCRQSIAIMTFDES